MPLIHCTWKVKKILINLDICFYRKECQVNFLSQILLIYLMCLSTFEESGEDCTARAVNTDDFPLLGLYF